MVCANLRRLLTVVLAIAVQADMITGQTAPPAQPRQVELSTTSEVARSEFHAMMNQLLGSNPNQAREHGLRALAADSNFGLVRVYMSRASLSPGQTPAQRAAEASRGLALMTNASPAELLLAVFAREVARGRTGAAVPIIRAVSEMAPGDPYAELSLLLVERPAPRNELALSGELNKYVDRVRNMTARHPDFGPTYNLLAYDLWTIGDSAGALAAARRQVELLPDAPNAHDSWADMLLQHGRLDEATEHTVAATKLDSTIGGPHLKLGSIELQRGNYDRARIHFRKAGEVNPAAAIRVEAHYWNAASHLYQKDTKAAMRELEAAAALTVSANAPANVQALPHNRMAVVSALTGDRNLVESHLEKAKALAPNNEAVRIGHAFLAYFLIGDKAKLDEYVRSYSRLPDANDEVARTNKALAAMLSGDISTVEAELARRSTATSDRIRMALRADLLKAKGRDAEANALREQILRSSIKADGTQGLNFAKLFARLYTEKIQ